MQTWLGIASFLGTFGVLLTSVRLLQLRYRLSPELTRKLPHVAMGLAALTLPLLFDAVWPVLLLAALNLGVLLALKHSALRSGLGQVFHGIERRSLGDVAYPVAIALVFALSRETPSLYVPSVLLLALADAAANLVGLRWGRRHYSTADGLKTLEGSAAFFAFAFVSVAGSLLLGGRGLPTSLLVAALIALATTLIEAASWRGLDNLFVPLGGFLLLQLLLAPAPGFALGPLSFQLTLLAGGFTLLRADDPRQLAPFLASRQPCGPLPDLAEHAPDASWLLLRDASPVACCSLWWSDPPPLDGQRPGLIGHYAACDREAATRLLDHACQRLARRHCSVALGPIDGSTWRSYRLVTERGDAPPFLLEPDNSDDAPRQWREAGFRPLTHYLSTLQADLGVEHPQLDRILDRVTDQGIVLRPLRLRQIDRELMRLYRLTLLGFGGSFLFRPLREIEFARLYRRLLPLLDPELVLIAVRDGHPLGYLFALPDHLQARRGERVDTLIVKTLAVRPEARGKGLSTALLGRVLRTARARGYRKAIHALMKDDNTSVAMSRGYRTTTLRRYALYARELS